MHILIYANFFFFFIAGKGLQDGDVLLGFVVQRGSTLDIVPVGPNHSVCQIKSCQDYQNSFQSKHQAMNECLDFYYFQMEVSSCHEELMSSTCPVSSSNGVGNVR